MFGSILILFLQVISRYQKQVQGRSCYNQLTLPIAAQHHLNQRKAHHRLLRRRRKSCTRLGRLAREGKKNSLPYNTSRERKLNLMTDISDKNLKKKSYRYKSSFVCFKSNLDPSMTIKGMSSSPGCLFSTQPCRCIFFLQIFGHLKTILYEGRSRIT